jgi:GNAT superfamily N-acetyltransferase
MRDRSVVVQRATVDDIDVVASIWLEGWRDAHLGHVPVELERARLGGSWREEVAGRVAATWVAEIDGRVEGFVTIVGDEVEDLYVAAGARGTGVAATLLRHGEGLVRDAGFSSAWLAVVAGNERARRFYERHGWLDEGPFHHHARTAGGAIAVLAHRYRHHLGAHAPKHDHGVDHIGGTS